MSDDDYVYDEESGEWMPASELAERQAAAGQVEVRDAVGNLLADGDSVTLIKDLTVKGAGQTLKQGTVIPSIRLTGKITLNGALSYARRSLVDSLTGGNGNDNTTLALLGANWAATRIISVGCKVGHETRSASGFGSFDYSGSNFGCQGSITLN